MGTDRQTDRETDRQTDRQTNKQTDRDIPKRQRQTDRQSETGRHVDNNNRRQRQMQGTKRTCVRHSTHTHSYLSKLTTGFIQTPNWTRLTECGSAPMNPSLRMNTWAHVTILPRHHSMVTALDIDLQEQCTGHFGSVSRLELWVSQWVSLKKLFRVFLVFFSCLLVC